MVNSQTQPVHLVKLRNVKVVKGDATTAVDPSDRLAVSRAYPHSYGQPLVQLIPRSKSTTVVKHAPLRFVCITIPKEVDLAFCEKTPHGEGIWLKKPIVRINMSFAINFVFSVLGIGVFPLICPSSFLSFPLFLDEISCRGITLYLLSL